MKRILARAALVALMVALILSTGVYLWLRTSLPQADGTLDLGSGTELSAEVRVVRDPRGVPHIRAGSAADAYFALGFVHAQDRLWQMEMMRRYGAGRLAEVLGKRALGSDRMMRVLGLYRLAEQQVERLLPEVRDALEAYARGVNAWLDNRGIRALPPEFVFLAHTPEPWTPADSLVWGKIMALRLGGNWRDELLRERLKHRLSPEQIRQLWPDSDGGQALVASEPLVPDTEAARLLAALPADVGAPVGASNAWAVSGEHSTGDAPILANDPHLGFEAPILWYMARIEAPGLMVTGATVPGVPFFLLGHNGRLAWGLSSTQSDIADLFVERLQPDDPSRYLTPDGPQPFKTREETIRVRGGRDVTLTVRETRHGPVISDLLGGSVVPEDDRVLALSATFLNPGDLTPQAVYGMNHARDWDGFRAALADFHAPQQTVTYADSRGTIASYAAGKVPRRAEGAGWTPGPGWTGEADWSGFLPFRELPQDVNPFRGHVVSANQKPTGEDYPHPLPGDWAPGYRARRIAELVDAEASHSLDSMARIQRDVISPMARHLVPLMTDIEPVAAAERRVATFIRLWDGEMSRRRPEPLIFMAWLRAFAEAATADELGDLYQSYWSRARPSFLVRILTENTGWCDNIDTPVTEYCPDLLTDSLARVMEQLHASEGTGYIRWHWGERHVARFLHPLFARLPGLRTFWGLEIETDGGDFTINNGAMRAAHDRHPYEHVHGPGFRALYDLSDLRRSRFIVATGQSGNPLSSHYGDQLEAWRDGRYMRLNLNWRDLETNGEGILILRP